jgi:hypothetical protein
MEIKKALSHPLNELKVDQKTSLRNHSWRMIGQCFFFVFLQLQYL